MIECKDRAGWTGKFFMPPVSMLGMEMERERRVVSAVTGFRWQRYSGSTLSALATLTMHDIAFLSELYTFRSYPQVSNFLRRHLEVGAFLLKSYSVISDLSPDILHPVLEVVVDPENGAERLFLLFPTRLPVKEARPILRALDQSWWLTASEQVAKMVSLDFEYI